jgi:hypothetical protein
MVSWTCKRPRQNKANSRICRETGKGREQSCETKPIPRSPAGTGGRNVRNKAKLGQDGTSGRRCAGVGPMIQNKPNSRLGRAGQGQGTTDGAYRAKQTQFAGGQTPHHSNIPSVQNKANLPGFGGRDACRRGLREQASSESKTARGKCCTQVPCCAMIEGAACGSAVHGLT